jgi:hypothetical protein
MINKILVKIIVTYKFFFSLFVYVSNFLFK